MTETISQVVEFATDERGLSVATWLLILATSADAEVGRRIYSRVTKIYNLVGRKEETTSEPIRPMRRHLVNSATHRF